MSAEAQPPPSPHRWPTRCAPKQSMEHDRHSRSLHCSSEARAGSRGPLLVSRRTGLITMHVVGGKRHGSDMGAMAKAAVGGRLLDVAHVVFDLCRRKNGLMWPCGAYGHCGRHGMWCMWLLLKRGFSNLEAANSRQVGHCAIVLPRKFCTPGIDFYVLSFLCLFGVRLRCPVHYPRS